MKRLGLFVCIVLACILAAGCGRQLFEEQRVSSQDKAATAHVAVISAGPFEDYKEELKPKFGITGDAALNKVIKSSRDLEEKFFDAMLIAAKVAPPTSSESSTTTERITSSGISSDTSKTQQTGPGDASKVQFETFPDANRSATNQPGSVLSQPTSTEPMFQYDVATALFQEVKVLNQYIDNPIRRKAYTPYVVRIQITVMPFARNLPYDIYTNLSFFVGEGQGLVEDKGVKLEIFPEKISSIQPPKDNTTGEVKTKLDKGTKAEDKLKKVEEAPMPPGSGSPDENLLPDVIPMLVTDAVETTMHSRSVDKIRQIAIAASALIHGFSASGSFQRRTEELQTVLGQDYNSLLTVGKVTQNTLRVRLGAIQQVQANHGMIPRANSVTVLLLVPDKALASGTTIRILAHTKLRDAKTGKELNALDDDAERKNHIRNKYLDITTKSSGGKRTLDLEKDGNLGKLTAYVTGNKYNDFTQYLKQFARSDENYPWWGDMLWEDLTSALGNRYSITEFFLEKPPPSTPSAATAPPDWPVNLIDDGRSAKVTLVGGKGLKKNPLAAELRAKDFSRPALVASIDSETTISLVFPSLDAQFQDNSPFKIVLSGASDPLDKKEYSNVKLVRVSGGAGFTVSANSEVLEVRNGTADLVFNVSFSSDTVATIVVKGMTFGDVDEKNGISAKAGVITVSGKAGTSVQVKVEQGKNFDDEIELTGKNAVQFPISPVRIKTRRIESK